MEHSTKQDGRPSMQFYPGDWRTDTGLRLCSLEARGLWIEMLCIMWVSPKRGCLLEANGNQIEAEGLARLVGAMEADTKQSLSDLQAHDVYSTLDDGTIYNRRMYRQWKQSRSKAEAGRKGGKASKSPSKTEAKTPSSSSTAASTAASTPKTGSSSDVDVDVLFESDVSLDEPKKTSSTSDKVVLPVRVHEETAKRLWNWVNEIEGLDDNALRRFKDTLLLLDLGPDTEMAIGRLRRSLKNGHNTSALLMGACEQLLKEHPRYPL